MIQLDLFGDGVADTYTDAHKLKHSRKKLEKKCSVRQCKTMVPNKPSSHKCPDCMVDDYLGQELITQSIKIIAR